MATELKECPGCEAEKPMMVRIHPLRGIFSKYYVECWNCHYCGKTKVGKRRAKRSWNRIWRGY